MSRRYSGSLFGIRYFINSAHQKIKPSAAKRAYHSLLPYSILFKPLAIGLVKGAKSGGVSTQLSQEKQRVKLSMKNDTNVFDNSWKNINRFILPV